ncbi:uncharacterized protein TNCV_4609401 [Trichonephila clavipes]|nr:uncharacterized protein TNCV_4609401 [Trichonephila clavipes]
MLTKSVCSLTARYRGSKENGLLNIKIGFKCCLRTSPDSVSRRTPDVFWYNEKGALETSQYSFSDEAHFWLNGYVNKQNCRIWSEANPQAYVETPLHPEKLTVWCALWAGGIISPYFFKNDEGHNVTVNGDRY